MGKNDSSSLIKTVSTIVAGFGVVAASWGTAQLEAKQGRKDAELIALIAAKQTENVSARAHDKTAEAVNQCIDDLEDLVEDMDDLEDDLREQGAMMEVLVGFAQRRYGSRTIERQMDRIPEAAPKPVPTMQKPKARVPVYEQFQKGN